MDSPDEVRAATEEELETASALRGAMAREMGHDWDSTYPGWRERFADYWRGKQRAGLAQVYVAVLEGDIVGMAIASISDEYRAMALREPRGYINGVYVEPLHRRRGIARSLMRAAVDWIRERGCVMVRLRSSAAGRALYESLGFGAGYEMELPL